MKPILPKPDLAAGVGSPLLMTIPQTCGALNLGQTTVKQLIKTGKLRSILVFGARRIPWSAIVEFAETGTGDGSEGENK